MSLFEENAEVLRNLANEGRDLGPPRSIDFSLVFPDITSAKAFARDAEQEGFSAVVEQVKRAEAPWDVTVSAVMVPTCENITDTEERLDAMAQSHRGRSDGWGFLNV
jgi:hypothetical protein